MKTLTPQHPDFPPWATGYALATEVEPGRWLTMGPLIGDDRWRIRVATPTGVEDFW